MATERKRYVDTAAVDTSGDGTTQNHSSGDNTHAYQSSQLAEAGEQGDISTSTGTDEQVSILCAGGQDNTDMAISGWTQEAANYIKFAGDPDAPDGDGVNTGDTFSTSYYYKDKTAENDSSEPFSIRQSFVRIEDMQFLESTTSQTNANLIYFEVVPTGTCDNRISRCRFKHAGAGSTGSEAILLLDADTVLLVENCVFDWDASSNSGFIMYVLTYSSCTVYNSVFYGGSNGIRFGSGTLTVFNCGFANNTTDIAKGGGVTGTFDFQYNAADDDLDTTLSPDASNNIQFTSSGDTPAYGSDWTNAPAEDFTITDADSILADAGDTDSGAAPTTDILGNAFGTQDIGPFAFSATSIPIFAHHYNQMKAA